MKQLTCEMCGSTDLLKQDGVFVCQTCGCKYSVEEAKKMMVEGTIKIDNSDKITNFYRLARTAKDEDDSEMAAKYYGLIREENPESWEAKFYSIYYEAMECKAKEAYSMCKKLEKIAPSILSSIKNNEPEETQIKYVLELTSKIREIAIMLLNGNSEDAAKEVPNLEITWGDQLDEKYYNIVEITKQAASFWENALAILIDTYGTGEKEIDNIIEKYSKKIRKYNNNYVIPKSKITIHTATSPNKATVEILKIGHKDFSILPFTSIPVQYVASGPDSAGGISVELKLNNIRGKTIKYATLYVTAFDKVGVPAACTIQQEATRALSITGPIEAGKDSGKLIFETIWYNPTITSVRVHSMMIEYLDGTKEKYKGEEFGYSKDSSSQKSQKGTVIFHGFKNSIPIVSTVKIRINGTEIGSVSRGQTFSWNFEGTAIVDLKYKGDFSWRKSVLSIAPGVTNVQLEYNAKTLISKTW